MGDRIMFSIIVTVVGIVGIYFTFFYNSADQYDSVTTAYKIEDNSRYDSDDNIVYNPIFYFVVNEKEYVCDSNINSITSPSESKNKVYYDSNNPETCMTEYDKTSMKPLGVLLIAFSIFFLILILKNYPIVATSGKAPYPTNQEVLMGAEKTRVLVNKISLIINRVVLGIIIFILFIVLLIYGLLIIQTIKTRDYIDATAKYVTIKENDEDSELKYYIYEFADNKGNHHEIVESSFDDHPQSTIKIIYDEDNPEKYYTEGSRLDAAGIVVFFLLLIIELYLIYLFFNKKLLSGIMFSIKV